MSSKPNRNQKNSSSSTSSHAEVLLLGPFAGKPACQYIPIPHEPKNTSQSLTGAGVCADGYYFKTTLRVENVDEYPGHIACDGETKSELVIPIFEDGVEGSDCVGVLDLDCLALGGFEESDQKGLERIARLVGTRSGWVKTNS